MEAITNNKRDIDLTSMKDKRAAPRGRRSALEGRRSSSLHGRRTTTSHWRSKGARGRMSKEEERVVGERKKEKRLAEKKEEEEARGKERRKKEKSLLLSSFFSASLFFFFLFCEPLLLLSSAEGPFFLLPHSFASRSPAQGGCASPARATASPSFECASSILPRGSALLFFIEVRSIVPFLVCYCFQCCRRWRIRKVAVNSLRIT